MSHKTSQALRSEGGNLLALPIDEEPVMHQPPLPSPHHQRLLAAAIVWLSVGIFLLLTTLVPAHNSLFGWTPTFWLLGAPLIVLLALELRLPRQLLMRRRSRRIQATHGVVWH